MANQQRQKFVSMDCGSLARVPEKNSRTENIQTLFRKTPSRYWTWNPFAIRQQHCPPHQPVETVSLEKKLNNLIFRQPNVSNLAEFASSHPCPTCHRYSLDLNCSCCLEDDLCSRWKLAPRMEIATAFYVRQVIPSATFSGGAIRFCLHLIQILPLYCGMFDSVWTLSS